MVDYEVFKSLNNFAAQHDGIEDPVKAYVQVSEYLFAAGVVILFVLFAGVRRHAAAAAAVAAAASLLVAHFLAAAVDRSRPFVAHPGAHLFIHHGTDPGFPSDHATGAFAIAFAILLRDRLIGSIAVVLAVVLAVGRVMLGVHYPGDVLAGAVLGGIAALITWIPAVRDLIDRIADWVSAKLRLPHARAATEQPG